MPATALYPRPSRTDEAPRPWTPLQILGLTFFGGPLAGGLATAVNLRRMGRGEFAWVAVVVGFLATAGLGGLIAVLGERTPYQASTLLHLFAGFGFMYAQRSAFDRWRRDVWAGGPWEKYSGGGLGLLILLGVIGLGIQAGLAGATVFVDG